MENSLLASSEPLDHFVLSSRISFEIAGWIVIIILFLLLSALITAAEVDYFGANSSDHHKYSDKRKKKIVLENLGKPEKIMATIMVSNLISNVAIIILTFFFVTRFSILPASFYPSFAVVVLCVSLIILLAGEILPRIFATRHPWQAGNIMAYPLSFFEKILRPVNHILIYSTSLVTGRLQKLNKKSLSVNEISQVLEMKNDEETSGEKEILEGIVSFGNKNVSDIMCPRVDVAALDIKSTFDTILDTINESGYSRIPVYEGSFDHVSGILYIKDLLPYTEKGLSFPWQKLLRTPFFVPETKRLRDLLEDFQKNKIHMAVVVDEYGGSSGIVTLEDVLEEIVGDIADELDDEESLYTKMGEKIFLFEGKTPFDRFCKIVECDENYFSDIRGEADSLAGLVLEITGDIPKLHDEIYFNKFRFIIESVTSRRIHKIRVEFS